jgi:hypothetical protein
MSSIRDGAKLLDNCSKVREGRMPSPTRRMRALPGYRTNQLSLATGATLDDQNIHVLDYSVFQKSRRSIGFIRVRAASFERR